jgi:hypothetical protein
LDHRPNRLASAQASPLAYVFEHITLALAHAQKKRPAAIAAIIVVVVHYSPRWNALARRDRLFGGQWFR